jgi:hypothetical protein
LCLLPAYHIVTGFIESSQQSASTRTMKHNTAQRSDVEIGRVDGAYSVGYCWQSLPERCRVVVHGSRQVDGVALVREIRFASSAPRVGRAKHMGKNQCHPGNENKHSIMCLFWWKLLLWYCADTGIIIEVGHGQTKETLLIYQLLIARQFERQTASLFHETFGTTINLSCILRHAQLFDDTVINTLSTIW